LPSPAYLSLRAGIIFFAEKKTTFCISTLQNVYFTTTIRACPKYALWFKPFSGGKEYAFSTKIL